MNTASISLTSKKEAQRFLRDVLADVEAGSYVAPARLTVRQWLEDEWLPSRRPGHANVAITIDTYSHVLPAADAATAHTLAKLILGGS